VIVDTLFHNVPQRDTFSGSKIESAVISGALEVSDVGAGTK